MSDTPTIDDHGLAAETLLQEFLRGYDAAIDRVHRHLPQVKYGLRDDAAAFPLTLKRGADRHRPRAGDAELG